jgi:Flp pilus assembly protein TadB
MLLVSKNKAKNTIDSRVDTLDKTLNYLTKRKPNNIQKSLVRPLYQEALKCLFLVVVLLVDTFIPLQILVDLPNIVNVVFALVALVIFLYVEMRIYNLLWGKKGRWSLEKYKKTSEKREKESN